jgi:hypothetical protein
MMALYHLNDATDTNQPETTNMKNTDAYMITLRAAVDAGTEAEATFAQAATVVAACMFGTFAIADQFLRVMDTAPREYLMDALEADKLL